MQLSEIIIQKIERDGPISFRDFMEMALYYPRLGYYTSGKIRIGKTGDYYTSPILSTLFGKLLGRQIEEMYAILEGEPVVIIEYGGGTGALCLDILNHLQKNTALYNNIKYYIIERNSLEKSSVANFPKEKIEFISDISELRGFKGCVVSNELLDNFSVHRVVMKDELMEICVDYQNGFKEVLRPASEGLKNYLTEQKIALSKNYITEINLQAIEWIKDIAFHLTRGFVVTIDYGFPYNELYSPKRSMGTLACYYKHTVTDTPYVNIGDQDITAHVNFSALNIWGEKWGLEYAGFCNQNYFLRSLGLASHLRELQIETTGDNQASLAQINKLLLDMGDKFKVLIQSKGVPPKRLTGMQFSRPVL